MDRQAAIAAEGDPNEVPWRNREGGPVVEWVEARELLVGQRVLTTNKTIFTVRVCRPEQRGLWRLTLDSPEMAHTTTITRPQVVPAAMPRVRDVLVAPTALYRRLV